MGLASWTDVRFSAFSWILIRRLVGGDESFLWVHVYCDRKLMRCPISEADQVPDDVRCDLWSIGRHTSEVPPPSFAF